MLRIFALIAQKLCFILNQNIYLYPTHIIYIHFYTAEERITFEGNSDYEIPAGCSCATITSWNLVVDANVGDVYFQVWRNSGSYTLIGQDMYTVTSMSFYICWFTNSLILFEQQHKGVLDVTIEWRHKKSCRLLLQFRLTEIKYTYYYFSFHSRRFKFKFIQRWELIILVLTKLKLFVFLFGEQSRLGNAKHMESSIPHIKVNKNIIIVKY